MSSECTAWIRLKEPLVNAHPGSDGMNTLDQVEYIPWIRWNAHTGSDGMYALDQVECMPWIRWNEQGMNTLDEVE